MDHLKTLFFGWGRSIVTEHDLDRKALIEAAGVTFLPCFQVAVGTKTVPVNYPSDGPTEVISLQVEDANEASHDGTIQVMDRYHAPTY